MAVGAAGVPGAAAVVQGSPEVGNVTTQHRATAEWRVEDYRKSRPSAFSIGSYVSADMVICSVNTLELSLCDIMINNKCMKKPVRQLACVVGTLYDKGSLVG